MIIHFVSSKARRITYASEPAPEQLVEAAKGFPDLGASDPLKLYYTGLDYTILIRSVCYTSSVSMLYHTITILYSIVWGQSQV